jgi:hypothetical protein
LPQRNAHPHRAPPCYNGRSKEARLPRATRPSRMWQRSPKFRLTPYFKLEGQNRRSAWQRKKSGKPNRRNAPRARAPPPSRASRLGPTRSAPRAAMSCKKSSRSYARTRRWMFPTTSSPR